MKHQRFMVMTAAAVLISIAGWFAAPHELLTAALQNPAAKHKTVFKKAGEKWRIDKVVAKKNDEVSWSASNSDLYFQFTDSTLFGEYTYVLKMPNTLTLKVKGAKGIYPYAIFRTADSTFVTGNSPPTIIID